MLWRRCHIGRPVAATVARLVTVASRGDLFTLRLFDAATGADMGTTEPKDWPQWARGGESLNAMRLSASEAPEGVKLHWQIHHGYAGGAPPPAVVFAEAQQSLSGDVTVNTETGLVTSAPSNGTVVDSASATAAPHSTTKSGQSSSACAWRPAECRGSSCSPREMRLRAYCEKPLWAMLHRRARDHCESRRENHGYRH